MIRDRALFNKLLHDDLTPENRFKDYMAAFRPQLETCPCCGCRGNCRIHAYYYRYILDFRKGKPCCARIRVMRVICSCGHTHAILPDFIVPYRQHSLKYLVHALFAFYTRRGSVSRICSRFGLDSAFLYRLKGIYEDHKKLWLGAPMDARVSHPEFLRSLCLRSDISGLLHAFYQRLSFSFLQSHRNPSANCDGCALGK